MDLLEKIVSLSKRRGFIFPGSEIYGGLQNSWDYGPLGAELKKNIKDEWWKRFVRQRTDIVGIDAALMMNPKVWEASGHVAGFSDPLVECKKCHRRFRADQLSEDHCPDCEGQLTPAKQFNLMFKTFMGPVEEKANIVYLRPETAQAMFVNFKNVLDTTRKRLPFGIAQMGKAFRNEITPGNFIFRTREFEQMEIEYFVRPPKASSQTGADSTRKNAEKEQWEVYFDHWLGEMKKWLKHLGVSDKKIHYQEIAEKERAHYSKRTVDIEYEYPFGREELYGLAYRGDFDLQNHTKASGQDLSYTDPAAGGEPRPGRENPPKKFVPHVIEPTWGVDRSVLVAMLEAYHEEMVADSRRLDADPRGNKKSEKEMRVVMRFPTWLAPVKVAILPLSKKPDLTKIAKPIHKELSEKFVCEYDETQSIGKRYRRQDEIGTPFCITVDFETKKDKAVTVRDRDTMKQKRVKIAKLEGYLSKLLEK